MRQRKYEFSGRSGPCCGSGCHQNNVWIFGDCIVVVFKKVPAGIANLARPRSFSPSTSQLRQISSHPLLLPLAKSRAILTAILNVRPLSWRLWCTPPREDVARQHLAYRIFVLTHPPSSQTHHNITASREMYLKMEPRAYYLIHSEPQLCSQTECRIAHDLRLGVLSLLNRSSCGESLSSR